VPGLGAPALGQLEQHPGRPLRKDLLPLLAKLECVCSWTWPSILENSADGCSGHGSTHTLFIHGSRVPAARL
jgi:hypothetical protein